jgi:hypothetical protein
MLGNMRRPTAHFALIFLVSAVPALAWNNAGHRIAAAITYDHLTAKARTRVDEILRRHPDYATLLTRDSPPDPEARARAAFITAATWPDMIRSDQRFYDESQADAVPTPLLPGFPDMKRRTNWHYIDIPYSPEGLPVRQPAPPNIVSELNRMLTEIDNRYTNPALISYNLPWIIHLVQDVHQPLHGVARFLKSQPNGDGGGNYVYVLPPGILANGSHRYPLYKTLHSVWDDAAGTDTSDAYVTRMAAELASEFSKQSLEPSKDVSSWAQESYKLAKGSVYTFGNVTGTKEMPIVLSEDYLSNANRIARMRVALAGLRSAGMLNDIFKDSKS